MYKDHTDDKESVTVAGKTIQKNVAELDLSGCKLTERDILALAQCRQLEKLDLSHAKISDPALLERVQSLRWINLTGVQRKHYRAVRSALPNCTVFRNGNELYKKVPLDMCGDDCTDAGQPTLDMCDEPDGNRETVAIAGRVIPTDVTELDLSRCGLSSRDIRPLQYCTRLVSLDLSYNKISSLQPLVRLVNLQTLDLNGNEITDLTPLRGLTNLRSLMLALNYARNLQPLSGLTDMEFMNLNNMGIVDIRPLGGLTNLRRLALASNDIEDVRPLGRLEKLELLHLFNNEIDDFLPLKKLTHLSQLNIVQMKEIRPDQLRALKAALPDCDIVADPQTAADRLLKSLLGEALDG